MDVREVADLSRRYSSRESTARDGGAAGERFAVDVAQCRGPRELGRYSDSLRFGGFGDQIPVGGEIFCTSPDRPWGPPSLLYNGHRLLKRPGRGVDHPLPSSAEVKERVELYLHSPCTFTVCFRVNLPSSMTQCRLVINLPMRTASYLPRRVCYKTRQQYSVSVADLHVRCAWSPYMDQYGVGLVREFRRFLHFFQSLNCAWEK